MVVGSNANGCFARCDVFKPRRFEFECKIRVFRVLQRMILFMLKDEMLHVEGGKSGGDGVENGN